MTFAACCKTLGVDRWDVSGLGFRLTLRLGGPGLKPAPSAVSDPLEQRAYPTAEAWDHVLARQLVVLMRDPAPGPVTR